MKNASRLLAMLLAVAMFAAVAFTVSAFDDVKVEDNCYTAVNTLVSLEVIKGKTETTFAPDDAVTREQMAALMSRLYTTVATEGGDNYTPFTDLDDPYYNYVISWCYDAGVINGTTPSTFEPKANIMLQDAVTMACRLLGYNDLTYPLGYITKGRLIGLLDGLEGVAYDKELTRGETAILLYNALDADGAEVIKENRVTWYYDKNGNGYPVSDAYERNFQIALDVYNFKTETFQIVGTENFNLAGYSKGTEEGFYLVELDTKGQPVNDADSKFHMNFEDLEIAEDTNGDEFILAHLEILYKGDTLDDQDTVVLSSVIKSNLAAKNEVSVYFKKDNNTNKMVAQKDKILIDGKAYDADDYVYTVDANGVINTWTYTKDDPATAADETVDLSTVAPVFFQADENDEGKYAQWVYDLDNDGDADVIAFFPMSLEEITDISSKDVYKVKNVNTSKTVSFDTRDEDCTLVIAAEGVEEEDYVLTYKVGGYTYIAEVLEPVITKVTKKSTTKYTLATGDVVTFSKANNPIVGNDLSASSLTLDGKEIALYIVNDKIVYTENADALGYNPYSYAFVVNKADEETSVDTEDGTIETVYNLIAFINGKAVTIPTAQDYSKEGSYIKSMVTIKDIKDGKYILEPGMKIKDSKYEEEILNSTITYNRYSKVYKIGNKTVLLDANSEFYVQTNTSAGAYESIKRYTMTNTPTTALENQKLDAAIIRKNLDDNDKVESYTLVVAFTTVDPSNTFASGTGYTDHRIVLEKGITIDDKNAAYATFELLNPVTGAIESVVDDTVEVNDISNIAIGAVVTVKSSGKVSEASGTTGVATALHANAQMKQIARVLNDNLVTLYSGNAMASEVSQEVVLNGAKIVVLDYDENNDLQIEVTDDYSELNGKVARIYTESGMNYKPYYFVVLPYEWVVGDFTNLTAYEEDPNYVG